MNQSPFRSPSKRDRILTLYDSPTKNTILSPIKTPNGRAGLRSPEKRSNTELDLSARKRANKTIYSRLMDDEYDGPEDILDEQDRIIAERIIKGSRNEKDIDQNDFRNYGSDVELEIDLTIKSKRGRSIKRKVGLIDDEELLSSGSDIDLKNDNKSDEDLDLSEDDIPTKKRKQNKAKEPKPRKKQNKTKEPIYNTKSKRLNDVATKIKSIFHQDDEMFKELASKTSVNNEPDTPKKKDKRSLLSLLISQQSTKQTPLISGLKKDTTNQETTEVTSFKPLSLNYANQFLKEIEESESNGAMKLIDQSVFSINGAEGYFEQNHKRFRNNTTPLIAPKLTRDQFNKYIEMSNDILKIEKNSLLQLNKYLYHQWCFELSQNFKIILFGVGSKISVLNDFAENYFGSWWTKIYKNPIPPILVVNGYNPNLDIRAIVLQIASVLVGDKYPKHTVECIEYLIATMNERRMPETEPKLLLIIHNIDGVNLRSKFTPLSNLISIPEIWCCASIDHINSSLLTKNSNFIYHESTTYIPYQNELLFTNVLDIGNNSKINTKSSSIILNNLTENHNKLFKLLVKNQIEILKNQNATTKGSPTNSLFINDMYDEALNNLIVSNFNTFTTFMKEFSDHQMLISNKNLIYIPLNLSELEQIYNEI
ncbi:ORC2 [Candida pseudojiufengensis]|uniref:ORC2 n=1 Tax=Candida pseudojiufengensis TaxID=497109 RepID=UPI0022242429|nr:ORC2 [Candida pseudojiufengensis]KAI5960084.1 ORC2 [Candida pseudojiufengensis]